MSELCDRCGHDIAFHASRHHFACGLGEEMTWRGAGLSEACTCPRYRTSEEANAWALLSRQLQDLWDSEETGISARIEMDLRSVAAAAHRLLELNP